MKLSRIALLIVTAASLAATGCASHPYYAVAPAAVCQRPAAESNEPNTKDFVSARKTGSRDLYNGFWPSSRTRPHLPRHSRIRPRNGTVRTVSRRIPPSVPARLRSGLLSPLAHCRVVSSRRMMDAGDPVSLTPFHIAFPVDDLDAARAFYGTTLGCAKAAAPHSGSTSISSATRSSRI